MKRTLLLLALVASSHAIASSHREAPGITETPKVDATDFYMFRSYETGREGFVTFIANYLPLQDAYGGPNYFSMDPDALYEIHVDNNGDAIEDLTFQFRFQNFSQDLQIPVNGVPVAVPLINIGAFGTTPEANDNVKNLLETYTVGVIRGERDFNDPQLAQNASMSNVTRFRKPFDYIGTKSQPNYAQYADNHIWRIAIPGCSEGRVFVGQRRDPFSVNLGEIFDLINTNPLGPVNGETNTIADKNVTSLILEVPIACVRGNSDIIGAWTTASLPSRDSALTNAGSGGTSGKRPFRQVSRLGAPLVNEVVIGVPDKDRFNASEPRNDGQFAQYVTNPTLPELIEILFAAPAPNLFPRTDLIAAFLTGVSGLNQPPGVTASEMLRLNMGIAAKAAAAQNNLGVLGGDTAGFPNGRRPGDDVVDIELRVAMGALLPSDVAPAGQLPITDGATVNAGQFRTTFPYLNTPVPGARN